MNPDLPHDLVTAAADLGRRAAERVPVSFDLDEDQPLVVARIRDDETLEAHDLERFLDAPVWPRGAATLHDPADFAAYVTRLGTSEHTTLWADLAGGRIAAVLDDHADYAAAGWRRHTVALTMQDDVDWATWAKWDNKLVTQTQFADHIEQMTHTIVEPSAADMLEVVTGFHAKRNVTFRQQVNITSGDVQLTYDEASTATATTKAGHIEVPRQFTVMLTPWTTVDPVLLTARLRWRIEGGSLAIGYSLLRPDRARAQAFDQVLMTVRDGVLDGNGEPRFPLFLGAKPDRVGARS